MICDITLPEELEKYLSSASQNIPDTELVLCKNHAVNAIIGHYYSKYKSNGIPFKLKIDIPEKLTVSESDICLVIANLLENAFEASMKLDGRLKCMPVRIPKRYCLFP